LPRNTTVTALYCWKRVFSKRRSFDPTEINLQYCKFMKEGSNQKEL